MITLAVDCLVFQLATGESIPFSSDMVSVELMGSTAQRFDQEFVTDAAKAVFHYFKHEQGRQTVTVAEFAAALERVLGGFETAQSQSEDTLRGGDLRRLARDGGLCCELFFFTRLRAAVRHQLVQNPGVIRFHGLRGCVKELVGTRRWGGRCRSLEAQILSFLGECLTAERRAGDCSLMVK